MSSALEVVHARAGLTADVATVAMLPATTTTIAMTRAFFMVFSFHVVTFDRRVRLSQSALVRSLAAA
jgi:hypothetical protein